MIVAGTSNSLILHFSFSISHFTFGLPECRLLVRVLSCDFVDRSHLSAKQTIHEVTRIARNEIRKITNEKWKMGFLELRCGPLTLRRGHVRFANIKISRNLLDVVVVFQSFH